MANLTFRSRYKSDGRFQEAVDSIKHEAILTMLNINPETLNDAWEAGVRPLTFESFLAYMNDQEKAKKAPAKKSTKKKSEPKLAAEEPKSEE